MKPARKTRPALWLSVPGARRIRSPEKKPKPQRRRKFTNPQSNVRRQQYAEYLPAMLLFLAHNPKCQRCSKPTECVHHWAGRRGKQLLVQRDWRASCDSCNLWAKNNPKAAREEGWLAPVGVYHV